MAAFFLRFVEIANTEFTRNTAGVYVIDFDHFYLTNVTLKEHSPAHAAVSPNYVQYFTAVRSVVGEGRDEFLAGLPPVYSSGERFFINDESRRPGGSMRFVDVEFTDNSDGIIADIWTTGVRKTITQSF